MQLSVIGCGYLGAVHAVAMAELGHRVTGVDVDSDKIAQLSAGTAPFFEPELDRRLVAALASGRLLFTTDISTVQQASVHIIAVGTPQQREGSAADLTQIDRAVGALIPHLKSGDIVVGKSTVPVGTAAALAARMASTGATLVWNPEFLREGWALKDTIEPDRIVLGVSPEVGDAEQRAISTLKHVYQSAVARNTPVIVTDWATAELIKGAANAFLATKISFINAMAEVAEAAGADVTQLAEAIGHDNRIGHRFLGAGIGFGGGCLPKDIRAFTAMAEGLGQGESVEFLREVDAINLRRRDRAVDLVAQSVGPDLRGKKVAVLGAAFKPNSDDVRDSPALDVARRLYERGAQVTVTDPAALPHARVAYPQLGYSEDVDTTLRGADAVILATEWDEYRRDLSPDHAASLVRNRMIVDGRNCLDPEAWRDAGWSYQGMGRR